MLLTNDIPTSINQKKEAAPILGAHRTFNWFENLPKVCQELFTDAVQISDKRKSISGKWDNILSAIHTVPSCTIRGKFNELLKSEKYLCKPLKPSAAVLKIIYS